VPDFAKIRGLPLFTGISDGSFDTLTRGAFVQNFPPRVDLISEGDPADFLHIVISGVVELFSHWEGRETSMQNLAPVSTFILAATVLDKVYLMSARTLEKSRIVMVPSENVRAVFEIDNAFAKAVVLELAMRYRDVIRTTKNLKLRSSVERLANYLLSEQKRSEDGVHFTLPLEKRRLASLLGMTPENLSRTFALLQECGVEMDGKNVVVSDVAQLRLTARSSDLIDR
jgi:CRP/FNR family transcriptional regulator, transcriptional activator FtrB